MVACNTYLNNLNAIIAKESTCENLILFIERILTLLNMIRFG